MEELNLPYRDSNTAEASKLVSLVHTEKMKLECFTGPKESNIFFHFQSNMASNWSARSSNMLPMSSRMLTVLLLSTMELKRQIDRK